MIAEELARGARGAAVAEELAEDCSRAVEELVEEAILDDCEAVAAKRSRGLVEVESTSSPKRLEVVEPTRRQSTES